MSRTEIINSKSNLRGTIDIGSNSILLLIGEFEDGNFKELENHACVTALGRDLDKTGVFHEESISASFEVLKRYADISRRAGLEPSLIIATATEASRVASNAQEFFEKVKLETGIHVQVITSEAEAYYSTRGITFNTKFQEDIIYIMDIGGASTEIIKYNTVSQEILHDFSLPIGAVRLTNWDEENVLEEKMLKTLTSFVEDLSKAQTKKLYCVAGTMTSVGNMYLGLDTFVESEVHGLKIKTKELKALISKYSHYSEVDLLNHFPFLGKRAKTILGGLGVARTLFDELGVEEVEISTYGLRYGTLKAGGIANEYLVK
jgi:exopolyphosphatase/guanosine-5'-triphosphate,3'-diphosphate pyrophosphatase